MIIEMKRGHVKSPVTPVLEAIVSYELAFMATGKGSTEKNKR